MPKHHPAYNPPSGWPTSNQGPTFRAPTAGFQPTPMRSVPGGAVSWRLRGNPFPGHVTRTQTYSHSFGVRAQPLVQEPSWLTDKNDDILNDSSTMSNAAAFGKEAALPWNTPYSDFKNLVDACKKIYDRMKGDLENFNGVENAPSTLSSSCCAQNEPLLIKILLMEQNMRVFAQKVAGALDLQFRHISNCDYVDKKTLVSRLVSNTARLVLILIDGKNGRKEEVDLFYFFETSGIKGRENMPYQEAVTYIQMKWPDRI